MFNELLQTNCKRFALLERQLNVKTLLKLCFVRKAIEWFKQPMHINLQIIHNEHIKINDSNQYFGFIGSTLNYVTYVIS